MTSAVDAGYWMTWHVCCDQFSGGVGRSGQQEETIPYSDKEAQSTLGGLLHPVPCLSVSWSCRHEITSASDWTQLRCTSVTFSLFISLAFSNICVWYMCHRMKLFIILVRYLHNCRQGSASCACQCQVNYSSEPMMMLKPFKKIIRRRFQPGIWIRFRSSSHQKQLHLKVYHFQVGYLPIQYSAGTMTTGN